MVLSGAGVVLGVAREGLLILFFGFSEVTDTIHLYLLVTYSLGLLTDPIRLAGLNLFQTLPRRAVLAAAAWIVVPFGIAVAVATATLVERPLELPLLTGITATGVLMQLNHLTIAYRQRGGAVVRTQLVTLLPNVILIPGIVAVGLGGLPNPVAWVIACFFLVPIVQAVLLERIEDHQPEVRGPPPSLAGRLKLFGKHSIIAVGRQGFEIVVRTAMISLGEGFLTAFSLVTRVYASLRLVVVDTFIGTRLRDWSTADDRVDLPARVRLALHPVCLLGVLGVAVAVAYASTEPGSRLAFSLGYGAVLVLGFPYEAGARILYFMGNARVVPETLIGRMALLEILFAGLVFWMTRGSITLVAFGLVAWYVVRSPIQSHVILRTLHRPAGGAP